ncbi:signal recognition particle-docking protein FtsY [Rhizobium sp. CC-YZS058]|uniref:signal recognition particle-docking protein FtsY n=1 Tax=Rhizobium sp. CC-YZS058 TaxID=3042153 RepID=UPI002B05CC76|nr:signal recognition particle-docking protein FtsY [Rhizobium sp. CC-YZS058]MEA3536605.1 signal recognition particle-docking protein FtsY [Rhizobium sp. CC-YZS058]
MAFDFLKRVFTFDKVPEADETARESAETHAPLAPESAAPEPAVRDQSRPDPAAPEVVPQAPVAEAGERPKAGALPLAPDPVLPEEMDTAGGPSPDDDAPEAEDESALPLPAAEAIGELGIVPLSLLEAEADAEPATAPASTADPDAPAPAATDPSRPASLPRGFVLGQTEETTAPIAVAEPKRSWFQRLREGLARTSSQLTGQISALFTKRKLDDQTLEELEDLLIQADLGVETALRVTDTLASERYGKDVSGEDVARIMAGEIAKVLTPVAKPLQLDLNHKPHVILVVGVNGTGKTTTIGKLAAKLSGAGLKVMLAAGDTFRAAAIEQLKIWAERTGSDIVSSKLGADAAGLAYEAFEQARLKGSDVLIIDTAGRLQNRTELMAELEKIVRVLGKLDPDAPHTVLQTLDATTGQNALNQVEIFRNVAGVNGLVMTKLDGTARGGILVAISAKHKLPVYFIGVGEGVDDLEPFDARDFASAIAGVALDER